jgi:hypothetical protein
MTGAALPARLIGAQEGAGSARLSVYVARRPQAPALRIRPLEEVGGRPPVRAPEQQQREARLLSPGRSRPGTTLLLDAVAQDERPAPHGPRRQAERARRSGRRHARGEQSYEVVGEIRRESRRTGHDARGLWPIPSAMAFFSRRGGGFLPPKRPTGVASLPTKAGVRLLGRPPVALARACAWGAGARARGLGASPPYGLLGNRGSPAYWVRG